MAEPKPTRKFFRKAVAPPPKPPCDPHARKYHPRQTAVSEMADPLTGARVMRKTNASWAYRKIAASKAGKASQASGNANRFTSESGRKASLKLWKTRQRKVNGIRIGVKLARRPKLDRIAIRRLYTGNPKHGIEYMQVEVRDPATDHILDVQMFWQRTLDGVTTVITERTALIRLGYMKQYLRFVPTSVRLLPLPGTKGAVGTGESQGLNVKKLFWNSFAPETRQTLQSLNGSIAPRLACGEASKNSFDLESLSVSPVTEFTGWSANPTSGESK